MRNGKLMTTRVAAIALSSMMVLSPLTAFASSAPLNAPLIQDPYNDPNSSIQDSDGFLTEAGGYRKDANGEDTRIFDVNFKKSLGLLDYKNTDFIPSVPDVKFTYTLAAGTNADASLEKPNSYYNDDLTLSADVFAGQLDFGKGNVFESTDLSVSFRHGDIADGDIAMPGTGKGKAETDANVMTRLVEFAINEAAFDGKDPGVYRYVLTETNVIDLDKDGNETTSSGVQDTSDDTNKVADEYAQRYIDIAIGRKTDKFDDPTRVISGVILYEKIIDKQSGETKISKKKSEGYVPWSYEDEYERELFVGPEKPKHYSRYDTFDLLVDKEIFGTGLKDPEDVTKVYNIEVSLAGPANTEVKVVVSSAAEGATVNDSWKLNEEGTVTKTIGLKNGQFVEISGLPSGSTYTVKEMKDSILSKVYAKENAKATDTRTEEENGVTTTIKTITMNDADKLAEKVDHDLVIDLAKNSERTERDDQGNAIIVKEKAVEKLYEMEDMDVQNVLIANERQPVTVTGVVMNVAPYALMVIAAAIFAGLFISKKRQEEEI